MKIERLTRFPIKGLGPEDLEWVDIEAGGSFPHDRVFAIAHGQTAFDAASPEYLPKRHFLMLMNNPRLAALKTRFHGDSGRLSIKLPDGSAFDGSLRDAADRARLEALLGAYVGTESRGGPPRLVSAPGHRFFDMPDELISLINLESVADLSRALGVDLDPLRFRGNLCVSGLAAWKEKELVGATLVCGDVAMQVVQEITRCQATCVNPETADVDVNVPSGLRRNYGMLEMGLYLSVIRRGRLCKGSFLEAAEGANQGVPGFGRPGSRRPMVAERK